MTVSVTDLTDADIDAIIARLADRAAATAAANPLVNGAGTLLSQIDPLAAPVGRVQVSPGQVIASLWGNNVWDQSVNVFANAADRDQQWPSPHTGAVCWLADSNTPWVYRGTVWKGIPLGILGTAQMNGPAQWSQISFAAATSNAALNVSVATYAGRLYRVSLMIAAVTAATNFSQQQLSMDNTPIGPMGNMTGNQTQSGVLLSATQAIPAGTHVFNAKGWNSVASQTSTWCSNAQPYTLVVEDVGSP